MNRRILVTLREVKQLLRWKSFSFDTETTSLSYFDLQLEGISMCNGNTTIYIPFLFRKRGKVYWELSSKKYVLQILKDVFNNADTIIAHNIPFDLKVLHKYGITPMCYLYDTMVADHILDEKNEHGLKKIVLREGISDKVKEYSQENTGSRQFMEYALNDAQWTWELSQKQMKRFTPKQKELFKNIEMPFQRVLTEMSIKGIFVDKEKVENIKRELYESKSDTLLDMCHNAKVGYSMQMDLFGNSEVVPTINFNSTQDLSKILFDKLGLPVVETTPNNTPSVGKLTLKKLENKHEFVPILMKYKIIQKLLSSFFEPMNKYIENDGKVRPNFKDTGTSTGRLSSNNPNIQQLPKVNKNFPVKTRECFIAPIGYKMLTADFSGQELRILAHLTQEPTLLDIFRKGKDMHLSTANDFFNLNIPEEKLYTSHPEFETIKDKYKTERTQSKIINFGIAYGKEAFSFSKDFNISEEEAQKILDKYFGVLPKVKSTIEQCHKEVTDNGFVETLFGRRRHFNYKEIEGYRYYPKSAYRQSFNFLIQGYASDMMRKAMVDVYNNREVKWDLQIIATVHDEIVVICKEDYVDEVSKFLKKTLEEAVTLDVPIIADVGIGDNYEEAK